MKAVFQFLCISSVAFSAVASDYAGDSYVIDQRDPKYQIALEHLSNAGRSLRLAQDELKRPRLPTPSGTRFGSHVEPGQACGRNHQCDPAT